MQEMNYELLAEVALTLWLAFRTGLMLTTRVYTPNIFTTACTMAVVTALLYVGGFFDALTAGPWYSAAAVWTWVGLAGISTGAALTSHNTPHNTNPGVGLFGALLILALYIVGGLYN